MGAVNSKMHRANLQTCSSWEVWKDDSPLSGQQTAPRSFAVTSQERNILRASCGSSKPQYLDMASWGEAGAWQHLWAPLWGFLPGWRGWAVHPRVPVALTR